MYIMQNKLTEIAAVQKLFANCCHRGGIVTVKLSECEHLSSGFLFKCVIVASELEIGVFN